MDFLFIVLGIVAGLIYAFIGYAGQKDPFSWRKFLRTMIIAVLATLGLDMTGTTVNIYTALVGPGAITIWLQKLIDTAKPA